MGYDHKIRAAIYGPADRVDVFLASQKLQATGYARTMLDQFRARENVPLYQGQTVTVLDLNFSDWGRWDSGEEETLRGILEAAEGFGLEWEYKRVGQNLDDLEEDSSEDAQDFLHFQRNIEADYDGATDEKED